MMTADRKPAVSCAVMAADDGDVAILVECPGFDPVAPVSVRFDGDRLSISQAGETVAEIDGIGPETVSMVRRARSVSVISVGDPGTPGEHYVVNGNTTVENREGPLD
jgi:hypothetical protein